MSIEHTFRVKDGLETRIVTKAKAIRFHCLDCSGYQPGEVVKCTCHTCALYPFRFGNEKGLDRTYVEKETQDEEDEVISDEDEDEWANLVDEEEE